MSDVTKRLLCIGIELCCATCGEPVKLDESRAEPWRIVPGLPSGWWSYIHLFETQRRLYCPSSKCGPHFIVRRDREYAADLAPKKDAE